MLQTNFLSKLVIRFLQGSDYAIVVGCYHLGRAEVANAVTIPAEVCWDRSVNQNVGEVDFWERWMLAIESYIVLFELFCRCGW